jgi:tetratricopeptide (TPR) repeat protein
LGHRPGGRSSWTGPSQDGPVSISIDPRAPQTDVVGVNTGVGNEAPLGRARIWVGAGLIAAAAAGAYADSFAGAFQFDDIPAILENPTLRHLWPPSVPLSPPPGALTVSGRPVLNLSLALNYAVSGYGTWSYHALNLLVHIGAALALFGIVRRTLAAAGRPGSFGGALAAALVWVVHPLTSESVTYVVQRAESMTALFYLLTLYGFIRYCGAPQAGGRAAWMLLSVFTCWLGMGTKEIMVSAPLAVILYDRTFVAGSWAGAWQARRGYYFGLASGWAALIWLVAGTGWDRGGTSGFHVGVPWIGYWATQGEAIFRYAGLSLWPYPLSLDYGPSSAPPVLAYTLSALVLIGFAATIVGCLRGRPWAFLAGVCFLILAPTSVMPGVLQFASEHRMYLPLASVVTAAVTGVQAAALRWEIGQKARDVALAFLLAAGVVSLGTATAFRNLVYRDELTLWMDTASKRPLSALAQANAGMALLKSGRTAEGTAYCERAVRLDPAKPAARYNLGLAYEEQRRWDDALTEFLAAANLNPKLFYAQFRAGRLLDRLGRGAQAERVLRQALAEAPDLAEAHGSLGEALVLQGRQSDAVAEFERSLAINPDQPEVEFNLGVCLAGLGRPAEAIGHYTEAVRLNPQYGEAQLNLGVLRAESGQMAGALSALRSAARLMPDSAPAHENLATVLDQLGRTGEAIAEFQSALRLRPDYAEAHYNFGNALIHERDLKAARAEFAEALRLRPGFSAASEMLGRLAGVPGQP